jgi:hypothetical protein
MSHFGDATAGISSLARGLVELTARARNAEIPIFTSEN